MSRKKPRHYSKNPAWGGGWIYGRHAVIAALANPERQCRDLLLTPGLAADLLQGPHALKLPDGLSPSTVPREEIDKLLARGTVHQGIALQADALPDPGIDAACQPAASGRSVVVVLDQVTDPRNVGAILRSAAAFHALAVITTDRHAPQPAGALAKAASGALEHVPYVRVSNLSRALDRLAVLGYWRLGLDGRAGQTLPEADSTGHVALVFGAEGGGLRHLTAQKCDFLVRLPMSERVESLNVSNAAAVALYELSRAAS